ncbi:FkbM family methyltransferase [Algiphilus aromaticivorans]|uniref:FkbM family methyltransferase n=1 Tax=Algiphilus aromaticivorans TaxID=382454 RepID=UPI0018DBDEBE|nr:FkbM family methyltransferase [Algiphilus aromaticivorans]
MYEFTAPLRRGVPVRTRKIAKFELYRALHMAGFRPSPSLRGLSEKFDGFLLPAYRKGFFIEAGGNDGFSQSNTYHLEKYYGWNGLLIEPVPWLADLAEKFRNATVERVALGRAGTAESTIRITEDDLKSKAFVEGQSGGLEVPVRPLSEILNEKKVFECDFFSLDVEGFECEVLSGVDFESCKFHNILIETSDIGSLPIPWSMFEKPLQLTHHDYLLVGKKD